MAKNNLLAEVIFKYKNYPGILFSKTRVIMDEESFPFTPMANFILEKQLHHINSR